MALQQNARAVQPGDVLVVVHDFDARSGDELTLRRSERVELIELDEGFGDGWYLGKHLTRGGTGLFPGVYTAKAPPATRSPFHTPSNSITTTAHDAATTSNHVPRLSINSASPPATQFTPAISHSETSNNPDLENTRSSLPAPHHTTYVQRSIGEALGEHDQGQDSPVMNETLNVIDEHITDLSTPRQSLAHQRDREESESDYSSHIDRRSFVAGPETDEEDNTGLDEATVRSWDHYQTAHHLRDIGLDPKHCDIFREQEISGDVLLDMDQNFIYMKEFDFGVMGRRLKTWHKIKDFQRDVKSQGAGSRRTSERGRNNSLDDSDRAAAQGLQLSAPPLYLAPSITEEPSDMPHPLQPTQNSKRTSWSGLTSPNSSRVVSGPEPVHRADTAMARRSRRHSSIDFGLQPDLELSSLAAANHKKHPSTDRSWSMAGSTQATTPTSSIRPTTKIDDKFTIPSSPTHEHSPLDLDRGYFSGNDMDTRKVRNRLSKSPRVGHSRQTSLVDQPSKRTSMMKRHNRLSSVDSVLGDISMSPTAAAPKKGRVRSTSGRVTSYLPSAIGMTPAVTNLENGSDPTIASPGPEKMRMQDRAKKLMGFRSTSEAVTPAEKSDTLRTTPSMDTTKSSELLASPATGDTTPSATPSLDMDTPESMDATTALTKNTSRPRPRTKQRTSAYTHGLLKIPPSEARKNCDHHGWMKKKSSGIMTTWKPRLFILRGRRLSYYYSEDDTEERGIIDISGHKVLVANNDPMVTIHASVTGANKAGSTPKPESEASSPIKPTAPTNIFYFKLVPPKSGMSRAVQFTKPAIHYFQVDSIMEGRKWMGEIMKATIEHDLSNLETTNKQKTISLAKARARRERPPALDDTKKVEEEEAKQEKIKALRESGLGIEFSDSAINLGDEKTSAPAPSVSKSLSTEGLAPKASTPLPELPEESEKNLPQVPEEEKENAMLPPSPGSTRTSKGSTKA
ncbi:polar growth protein [Knufia obscura]|uniref:Polar growth protein n=1 Tax=Knufia obscura TaxID=1635080 RepID=A0ABR0RPX9_9EURO|nr:polar growth protein [Knufia obscura]